ncbi:MAG: serine hydrolase [Dermatophilaceae bacterium]
MPTRFVGVTLAACALLAGPAPGSAAAQDRLSEAGVVSDLTDGTPAAPELAATAYLLADLGSGNVLIAKDAHRHLPPASTLKLLTAQTLLPTLDDNAEVSATDDDARVDGSRVGMVPGSSYTVHQLSQALLMQSANDAAEALARAAGGTEKASTAMNERAAALGARDTVAMTPHGLDADGQRSSAYDLVTILRGALSTPKVATLLTTRTSTFPGGSEGGQIELATQNKLLQFYDGTVGGKDGFTDAAGHTYVGAVQRGDSTYAVSWLGARSADWKPAGALLDWAFAHGRQARAVGYLPATVPPVDAAGVTRPAAAVDDSGAGLLSALAVVTRMLGWVLALLFLAVVALRIRKLRRDARRRLGAHAVRAWPADLPDRSPAGLRVPGGTYHPSPDAPAVRSRPTPGGRPRRGAPPQPRRHDSPQPSAVDCAPVNSKPPATRQGAPGSSTYNET